MLSPQDDWHQWFAFRNHAGYLLPAWNIHRKALFIICRELKPPLIYALLLRIGNKVPKVLLRKIMGYGTILHRKEKLQARELSNEENREFSVARLFSGQTKDLNQVIKTHLNGANS